MEENEKKILEDYKLQKQVEGGYFIDCQTQFDNTIKEEEELNVEIVNKGEIIEEEVFCNNLNENNEVIKIKQNNKKYKDYE